MSAPGIYVAADDPRLVFMPLTIASVPPAGIIEHMKNRWWVMHPEKGIVFFKHTKRTPYPGSPQCNGNETIARDIALRMYPWATVVFVPSVFYKVNPQDYV